MSVKNAFAKKKRKSIRNKHTTMVHAVYSFKERRFAEKRRNAIKVIMKATTYWIYIFLLYIQ